MAEDYPDYSPSYLVRHGSVKQKSFSVTVLPNVTTELCSATGKGIIYGGFIYVLKYSSAYLDEPRIEIDNLMFDAICFYLLDNYNICHPTAYPFIMLKYDENNYDYAVGISKGITFEKKLRILYSEHHGDTPEVKGFLNYALLE